MNKSNETGYVYRSSNPFIRFLASGFLNGIIELSDIINIDFKGGLGLDIGCADGDLLFNLSKSVKMNNLVAIDMDHQKILSSTGINKDISHCVSDAVHLPFSDGTFDYVMAMEVLEHIPEPEKAMAEILRVAKKNVRMIVSVPNEPFFHLGNVARGKYLDRFGKTPSHVNFWTRSGFESFLGNYLYIYDSRYLSSFPWQIYAGYLKN